MLKRPLIPLLLSLIGGIWIGYIGVPPKPPHLIALTLLIIALIFSSLFLSFRLRVPHFMVIFFLVGILLVQNKDRHSDLLPLANRGAKVMVEGTVREQSRISNGGGRFVLRADRVFIDGVGRKVREDLQVNIFQNIKEFSPGEKIRFPARLRSFNNFNNPGRYNYKLAMKLRGISCTASVSDGRRVVLIGEGELELPMGVLEKVRRPIRSLFHTSLSPRNEALFQALILGERQGIGSELRESFNKTGLGHVLAVSGLHIGLVAWLAFTLARGLLSLSYHLALKTDIRKVAAIITIFPVVAYTCLAGLHVSSQRAMIMVLAYLFSIIIGREKEVWSTLSLAALVVLAVNPYALFTISFQLSFCAVVGILWLAPILYRKIPLLEKGGRVRNTIIQPLYAHITGLSVVTLSAIIFLLPIIGFYFHRVSLVSIPANLTVVPILGFWIIPMGLLAAMSLPIPFLAEAFIGFGALGLDGMMGVIHFWGGFPWASFWVIAPSLVEGLLFYGLLLIGFSIRHRSWRRIGLFLILFLFAIDGAYWIYRTRFNTAFTVTYLDVGQGNAALIQFPGKERMLIDGGGFSRDNFDVGRMVIAPFLFRSKILQIDYLVLTHPQSDHMNGLRFIASNFRPKEFWHNGDKGESRSYKDLMNILYDKKTNKLTPADLKGGREVSGVRIELLHPLFEQGETPISHRRLGLNDNSLVLKFSYEGKSFLFPGDLERAGEEVVMSNSGSLLKSDILLAPHHGGRSSSSKSFLERVRPSICVISSGSGNPITFPHPETLKRLTDIGCRTIRIDQMGAVQISVGPDRYKIRSYLGGDMSK
jgi:competence protein ComEC